MLFLCCLLVVSLPSSFAEKTQKAYAQQDAEALRGLMHEADSRADSMLVRYRLYPLTEDEEILEGIPDALPSGSARELALLSGLWAYRAGETSVVRVVKYGRRSSSLLDEAKSEDPDDPYVLLVESQSLLFRPSIAGRDPEAAVDRLQRLLRHLEDASPVGIARSEAQSWLWLALKEADQSEEAQQLYEQLMDEEVPPLYREFLRNPPDV
ncbi:MAG: hypothetical protein ACLFTE_02235 [Salinivenus sp.]